MARPQEAALSAASPLLGEMGAGPRAPFHREVLKATETPRAPATPILPFDDGTLRKIKTPDTSAPSTSPKATPAPLDSQPNPTLKPPTIDSKKIVAAWIGFFAKSVTFFNFSTMLIAALFWYEMAIIAKLAVLTGALIFNAISFAISYHGYYMAKNKNRMAASDTAKLPLHGKKTTLDGSSALASLITTTLIWFYWAGYTVIPYILISSVFVVAVFLKCLFPFSEAWRVRKDLNQKKFFFINLAEGLTLLAATVLFAFSLLGPKLNLLGADPLQWFALVHEQFHLGYAITVGLGILFALAGAAIGLYKVYDIYKTRKKERLAAAQVNAGVATVSINQTLSSSTSEMPPVYSTSTIKAPTTLLSPLVDLKDRPTQASTPNTSKASVSINEAQANPEEDRIEEDRIAFSCKNSPDFLNIRDQAKKILSRYIYVDDEAGCEDAWSNIKALPNYEPAILRAIYVLGHDFGNGDTPIFKDNIEKNKEIFLNLMKKSTAKEDPVAYARYLIAQAALKGLLDHAAEAQASRKDLAEGTPSIKNTSFPASLSRNTSVGDVSLNASTPATSPLRSNLSSAPSSAPSSPPARIHQANDPAQSAILLSPDRGLAVSPCTP